ncbi:MAG: hypothetical protein ACOYEO_03500 [bacterium]|jgi:hypothetical protein
MRKWLWVISIVLILMVPTAAWAEVPLPEDSATEISTLSRGEFAALLVTAADLEGEGEPADILLEQGIMKGVPGKQADLDRPITRVEAAVLLGRSLGLTDGILAPATVDITLPQDHWAYSTYSWLTRLGLVSGDPLTVLTKEEGAALVDNVFKTTEEAIDLLEKIQAQSEPENISSLRVTMDGTMRLIPRSEAEGADEIPALTSSLQMIQEMVLPATIHQSTTVKLQLPDIGDQEIVTESYIVDGKMYQQLPDPETGELRWSRYPDGMVPDLEDIMEKAKQSTQIIPPGLEKSLFYKVLGTTELNGEQVYEIAFYGKIDDIMEFLSATLGSLGDSPLIGEALSGASSIIDSVSFWGLSYVGVDDYLTRESDYGALVTYAKEFQDESIPLEAIEMVMRAKDYTYNDIENIAIPDEVLTAPEITLPQETKQQ